MQRRAFGIHALALVLTGALSACEAGSVVVASGRFGPTTGESGGTAAIYRSPGGALALELDGVSVGPTFDVRLVGPEADASGATAFLVAGRGVGTGGRVRFDLPPGIDLRRYRAVVIWDRSRGLSVATAPLNP